MISIIGLILKHHGIQITYHQAIESPQIRDHFLSRPTINCVIGHDCLALTTIGYFNFTRRSTLHNTGLECLFGSNTLPAQINIWNCTIVFLHHNVPPYVSIPCNPYDHKPFSSTYHASSLLICCAGSDAIYWANLTLDWSSGSLTMA